MGATGCADVIEPNWLGVPMFFSHFDVAMNLDLVGATGLQICHQEIVSHNEDGKSVQFLWIIAQKPIEAT
jgi:hypothetical protein